MGTVSLRAGLLRRDHEYFGGKTALPAEIFYVEQMRNVRFGYIIPALDNGLGTASNALEFSQTNIGGAGKNAADFYYDVNNSTRVRYSVTCNSLDYTNALESTDAQNFVSLAVATGSGYTLQG